jgi:hypothetical protein
MNDEKNLFYHDEVVETEEEETKFLPWYIEGTFTLLPNTRWFKVWLICKSLLYLFDLYILTYQIAFDYDQGSLRFYYTIVAINFLDMFIHFFTAVENKNLTTYAVDVRSKLGLKYIGYKPHQSQTAKMELWCKNNPVLAVNYLTTTFFVDFLSIVPSLAFVNLWKYAHLFELFRFWKI